LSLIVELEMLTLPMAPIPPAAYAVLPTTELY
jgi:hypothetical protein